MREQSKTDNATRARLLLAGTCVNRAHDALCAGDLPAADRWFAAALDVLEAK